MRLKACTRLPISSRCDWPRGWFGTRRLATHLGGLLDDLQGAYQAGDEGVGQDGPPMPGQQHQEEGRPAGGGTPCSKIGDAAGARPGPGSPERLDKLLARGAQPLVTALVHLAGRESPCSQPPKWSCNQTNRRPVVAGREPGAGPGDGRLAVAVAPGDPGPRPLAWPQSGCPGSPGSGAKSWSWR